MCQFLIKIWLGTIFSHTVDGLLLYGFLCCGETFKVDAIYFVHFLPLLQKVEVFV